MVHQVATASAVTHVFVACSNEVSGVGGGTNFKLMFFFLMGLQKGKVKVKKLNNHRNEQLDAIKVQDPLTFGPPS